MASRPIDRLRWLAAAFVLLGVGGGVHAEETRFVREPSLSHDGDRVEIRFEVKSFCDVTVAIEDAGGNILRHLASGLLGKHAPLPFMKDELRQTVVWDGKDDRGRYLDDLGHLSVRVSLGLQARFEKNLYWEPKKRIGRAAPLMQATPEGVYVYDGGEAMDHLRLFDHEGQYVRTIYPFPAGKIEAVQGLNWHVHEQDGRRLPIKPNFLQNTMLTCGTNAVITYKDGRYESTTGETGKHGRGAMAMAVRGTRIALANLSLNRIGTDGTSGGMAFEGPRVSCAIVSEGNQDRGKTFYAAPHSAALSPDGKTLYLTGYVFSHRSAVVAAIRNAKWDCVHAVFKLDMDGPDEMQLFAGSAKLGEHGKDNAQFCVPASVAVDARGAVYVADYMNDRIQVFSPAGQHLKTIRAEKPAQLELDEKRNELYVFSFLVHNPFLPLTATVPATVTRMGPLSDPAPLKTYALPTEGYLASVGSDPYAVNGVPLKAALDSHAEPPVLWLAENLPPDNQYNLGKFFSGNIRLYTVGRDKLEAKRNFTDDARQTAVRVWAPPYSRQRLYVNPRNGRLYAGEGDAMEYKAFKELVEIDPLTGKIALVGLPFDAEDVCFDQEGHAYLRTLSVVARYDAETWREVPWDYGEELPQVRTSLSSDAKPADVISALVLPSNFHWHHGGMHVSPLGHLAVACAYMPEIKTRDGTQNLQTASVRRYDPFLYPGRIRNGTYLHVWDRRGRLVHEDAVPGVSDLYGIGLDRDENLYFMCAATRVTNGKRYYNDLAGTLVKIAPGAGKVLADTQAAPLPLPGEAAPKRAPDLLSHALGQAWLGEAEWMYGGVGFGGKNRGNGCGCWNARFAFDYFARSFVPEMDRYSVAVLDHAGNTILRLGRYGNVDSAGAQSRVPLDGDGVGLVHGAYLATHTDHRLFVADPANARIVSVRLGYRETRRLALGPHAHSPGRQSNLGPRR